ncbi:hypothetical protein GCM10028820_10440 [Tessaracoccus terricola]
MLNDTTRTRTRVRPATFAITTLDDVDAARAAILAELGTTEADLRRADGVRTAPELSALRRLDELVWAERGI